MANEDTLADTRKARLTPARLTRDMVRAKHRKASKVPFNPGRGDRKSGGWKETRQEGQFGLMSVLPIMKYAMAENKKMGMIRFGRRSAKILDRK